VIEGMFVCVLALVEHAEDPLPQIFRVSGMAKF
jgi:XTP/dITP diphosphohydrolase